MKKLVKNKDKTIEIVILLLVAIEQGIKIIVKGYYGVKTPIIENILYFMPILNDNYSYINSLFNLNWGRIFHIIMIILILFFSYYTFKYLETKTLNLKKFND